MSFAVLSNIIFPSNANLKGLGFAGYLNPTARIYFPAFYMEKCVGGFAGNIVAGVQAVMLLGGQLGPA